jgi:hypothetical protein
LKSLVLVLLAIGPAENDKDMDGISFWLLFFHWKRYIVMFLQNFAELSFIRSQYLHFFAICWQDEVSW